MNGKKGFINKDSKAFHEDVFDQEAEMDKFFKEHPDAEGFEIYDYFIKLAGKRLAEKK